MNCSVFRSPRKDYCYIYLADGLRLEDLPGELLSAFGTPEFVIALELSSERQLASENVIEVMTNLREQGYHLQLPPGDQQDHLI
jgi:uncharacterized protein YcgL (UPF0745 family)